MDPRARFASVFAASMALASATGCASVKPPRSQFPTGAAALERMEGTSPCGLGIQAQAKIDHSGERGRIRGDLLLYAVRSARLRMDIVSPFGVALATLTSDGSRFALSDFREKRFYVGPAAACNIARLTTVPVPGHAMVSLLLGRAPLLVHEPAAPTIAWDGAGYYVVTIPSKHEAVEEIRLKPHPDDWEKPWQEQRVRVLDVLVRQRDFVHYRAELDEHASSPMSEPLTSGDPVPGEPADTLPPSGPQCTAELPRRIHVTVPDQDDEVRFRYEWAKWNPPLPPATFIQSQAGGMQRVPVTCD